jgi:acyl-CoA thioester hydrolase
MSLEFKKPYTGDIQGHAHYFALRVYIEDTDFGGVVYHANYLKFLERARSDLLRLLGIDQRAALELGTGVYAVSEAHIKYRRPARLEDELMVVSKLEDMRGASCVISQSILRGEETLAEATIKVAFLGPEGRPKRQPAEWVEKLRRVTAPADPAQ